MQFELAFHHRLRVETPSRKAISHRIWFCGRQFVFKIKKDQSSGTGYRYTRPEPVMGYNTSLRIRMHPIPLHHPHTELSYKIPHVLSVAPGLCSWYGFITGSGAGASGYRPPAVHPLPRYPPTSRRPPNFTRIAASRRNTIALCWIPLPG